MKKAFCSYALLSLSVIFTVCLVGCSNDNDEIAPQHEPQQESHISQLTISDNASSLIDKDSVLVDSLVYQRYFDNTDWQTLYVPFSMSYDDWKDVYDIAKIDNVTSNVATCAELYSSHEPHPSLAFELYVYCNVINEGEIEPNTPYMIRAKRVGTTSVCVHNATICKTQDFSISFASSSKKCGHIKLDDFPNDSITFRGTYFGVNGTDMYANKYALISNNVIRFAENECDLIFPMRWFIESVRFGWNLATYYKYGLYFSGNITDNGIIFLIQDSKSRDCISSGRIYGRFDLVCYGDYAMYELKPVPLSDSTGESGNAGW